MSISLNDTPGKINQHQSCEKNLIPKLKSLNNDYKLLPFIISRGKVLRHQKSQKNIILCCVAGAIFFIFYYLATDLSSPLSVGFMHGLGWGFGMFFEGNKDVFMLPPTVGSIECKRFFKNDTRYIKMFSGNHTIGLDDRELKIQTSCEAIRKRMYFPEKARSQVEADYPLAFARIVYADYLFLEMEIAATYQPQNVYCLMVDQKADKVFQRRIQNFANCFPNIFVTKKSFTVNRSGENMTAAHYQCLTELIDYEWKYVVLLQNHDFALKTNAEMVQIFKWLNGSNDVEIAPPLLNRVDTSMNWTFSDMKLFRNETLNTPDAGGYSPSLDFAKGYVECSLSRAMSDFLVRTLDLTTPIAWLSHKKFGTDEILIPTLQVSEALNVPGGLTPECPRRGQKTHHVTRHSVWYDQTRCGSKYIRHAICVFGVGDLPVLPQHPHLFGNKFIPNFDFVATSCWYEWLHDRSVNQPNPEKTLPKKHYLNLAAVRYNNERYKPGFNVSSFECNKEV